MALRVVAKWDHADIVKVLLENGTDVEVRNRWKRRLCTRLRTQVGSWDMLDVLQSHQPLANLEPSSTSNHELGKNAFILSLSAVHSSGKFLTFNGLGEYPFFFLTVVVHWFYGS
jgi:hypothetical protein